MPEGNLISKLISSAVSVQNELSLAAANFNLDFTLVKLEAPKEFAIIGNHLTTLRREDAEQGSLHRTARKLGVLFDRVAPSAPHLLRAYGLRVSEITEQEKIDPVERNHHGISSRYSGPDASSIWAAATSGADAIAVHLLACMLASIFEGPVAVSTWWELIELRKAEVAREVEEELDQVKAITRALAIKVEFTRDEIKLWDNSARSWIQTANAAKTKERGRVLLSLDNSDIIVNREEGVYESVIKAWKDAVVSMDSLITGVPQKVQTGAVLLAMNSWYLYPDMSVLSRGPELI